MRLQPGLHKTKLGLMYPDWGLTTRASCSERSWRTWLLLAVLWAVMTPAFAEIGGSLDEPSGRVKLGVNPALSCPGFYVLRTHPGQESSAGRIGAEVLLTGSGIRTLQGGLNFGGWASSQISGFAGFSIANRRAEEQQVDITLEAEAAGRMVLERRSGGDRTVLVDQSVGVGRSSVSLIVPPGFYVIRYLPDRAGPSQFSAAALTSYVDRPGGGFQGGAVFGGYHDPARRVTAYGGFCIAEAFDIMVQVLSASYGSSGAGRLEFSIVSDGLIYLDSFTPPAVPVLLNDTGIDWCSDGTTQFLDCPVATHPGQDGDHGRDALARSGLLPKLGAGAGGFDYTKLDEFGQDLPASGNEWSCVRDNHTGLIWEVKVDEPGHLRWYRHTYGSPGARDFVDAVNAEGLCGARDWRLPTVMELYSVVHFGRQLPAIDVDFFPHTEVRSSVFHLGYWTAGRAAFHPAPWHINFDDGSSAVDTLGGVGWVRLVRDDG